MTETLSAIGGGFRGNFWWKNIYYYYLILSIFRKILAMMLIQFWILENFHSSALHYWTATSWSGFAWSCQLHLDHLLLVKSGKKGENRGSKIALLWDGFKGKDEITGEIQKVEGIDSKRLKWREGKEFRNDSWRLPREWGK